MVRLNLLNDVILLNPVQATGYEFDSQRGCLYVVAASIRAGVPIEHRAVEPDLPLHVGQVIHLHPLLHLITEKQQLNR